MIITNAVQTNHAAAANEDAVICHHKSFFAWYLGGSLPNTSFGDGCVFS